ncbi:MAG TPA: NAD+ synthase [Rhabdochlamydiaceae bacterium]|jgi:NAD+ synthase (glutamine-hydrolysing)|nr:NAD+ synthase [Rhabdochlamydiaceae bacterium]
MKVLVAQLDPTIGDFSGNSQKIIQALEHARKQKADIVLFPELSVCGYPPEDLVLHGNFVTSSEDALQEIIPHTQGLMALVGLVRRNLAHGEKGLLNSAAVIQDGKIVGFHDKALLPTYDVFDERRYFEPGTEFRAWEWRGKKIGVLICEDIWQHAGYVGDTRYGCDPVLEYQKLKIDLLLNLSASPYQYQKPDVRAKVCQKAAKTLKCPVILCAQVGANDQLVFDGYSVYINDKGELCQLAKGFQEDLMLVDLNSKSCMVSFNYDTIGDLFQALVLGTRDYFQKQNFRKAILGLSGGIDSALTACIAVEALGKENVYALSMPSQFNSPSSLKDAETLVKHLSIDFDVVPIDGLYETYLKTVSPFFQGKPLDETEENIQSRIRGSILMAFSNKLGYLLISTGNKSELAMGYCTLYGDMAGGLGVIADVSKTQVYMLARWINRKKEIIPQSIIDKPPSAELRTNQRDTDTLPDYAIVDAVLQAYVEDLMSPDEIAKKHGFPLELVLDLVHRIHASEYKRRQSAPGIRVTKKAFRVGRRYPIVQKWV